MGRSVIEARPVGLLGYGAIGRVVAAALGAGRVPGMALSCVVDRHCPASSAVPVGSIDEAIQRCDLIVEAAGHSAVRDHGRAILDAGVDLLVASVGALADGELAGRLLAPAPGRIYFTSGAVGGLDLLVASRSLGPFRQVTVTTTKRPGTLVQAWMDQPTRAALLSTPVPIEVYRGTAAEVAARFPKSANVAATVALAAGTWAGVTVVVRADPDAALTTHVIEADGPYGRHRFEMSNQPDETNPATSKVVPHAVLAALVRLSGASAQIM